MPAKSPIATVRLLLALLFAVFLGGTAGAATYPYGPPVAVPSSPIDYLAAGSVSTNSNNIQSPYTAPVGSFVGINPIGVNAGVVQVSGTFTGTLQAEGSNDGLSFFPINLVPYGGGVAINQVSAPGLWTMSAAAVAFIQLRATSWTSGTASISFHVTQLAGGAGSLGGANTTITQSNGSLLHATIDSCTGCGSVPTGSAGSPNVNVLTVQGIPGATAVLISGSVSLTGNNAVVGIGSAGSPSGGVMSIQGVPSGSAIPVSGSVTGNGNFMVVQPTGSNLHAVLDSGTVTSSNDATQVIVYPQTAATQNFQTTRLVSCVVTAVGTTNLNFTDNGGATIGIIPSTATLGQVVVFAMPVITGTLQAIRAMTTPGASCAVK